MNVTRIIAGICILIGAAVSAHSSASITGSGFSNTLITNPSGAGAAKMRCYINEKQFLLSVVTIMQLDNKASKFRNKDVAVTTGHGLVGPSGKILDNCFVYGPSGRRYQVRVKKLAPGFKNATPSDWAVIVIDKMRDKNLVRYAVDPELSYNQFENLAREKAVVKFSTARGILVNGQKCHLYPRNYASLNRKIYDGIVPHSCKSIRGQSGSPVSVSAVDQNILVGIHVGQSFSLPIANVTDRARWYGFMRIVDDDLLVTLSSLLNDIELED